MTEQQPWNILLVDDDEDDYLLTREMLSAARGRKIELTWAATFEQGRAALFGEQVFDAVLMDYDLGVNTGMELIREARERGCAAPIILLTGRGSYDVDVEAMQAGASLYITKNEVNSLLLERSIRYAIERKQAEQKLRDRNYRLALLAEISGELLRSSDHVSLLDYIFERLGNLLGFDLYLHYALSSDGAALELNAMHGVPQENMPDLARLVVGQGICGEAALTRRPICLENIQNQSGEKVHLLKLLGVSSYVCHPLMVQGQLYGALAYGSRRMVRLDQESVDLLRIVADIVSAAIQRSETEKRLRGSEERFRQLAESMPQLVWTANPDGQVDYYNGRYLEYGGIEPQEGGMWQWGPVLHPDDLQQTVETWTRAVQTGQVYLAEHRVQMADGTYRWHLSRGVPARDEQGRVARWFGTATDIHAQKETEEELRRANERLEGELAEHRRTEATLREREAELQNLIAAVARSNQDLQEFAFVASHDLQEPLRKIIAFSERLQQHHAYRLGEEGADYVERMHAAAARMQEMIRALLDYSRVSTRPRAFQSIDLTSLLGNVLSNLELRIRDTGAQVQVDPLPAVTGDPQAFTQLYQNLIGNALKFHRPGVPPHVRVGGRVEGNQTLLWVEDNGIGFDEAERERIFQPFQRLHGRSVYEGSGIGLAICRKIVERHGGTLTADSRRGEGSRFVIALPR